MTAPLPALRVTLSHEGRGGELLLRWRGRLRRHQLVAGGAERVGLVPVRPGVVVGELLADAVDRVQHREDPVQFPGRGVVLVAGLVIAVVAAILAKKAGLC